MRSVEDRLAAEGLVVLDDHVAASLVASARDAALARLDDCLAQIRARTGADLGVGVDHGFADVVQRARGRFDLSAGADRPPFTDPALDEDAPWTDVVRQALGPGARRLYGACS